VPSDPERTEMYLDYAVAPPIFMPRMVLSPRAAFRATWSSLSASVRKFVEGYSVRQAVGSLR
jgi:hypothetical protein